MEKLSYDILISLASEIARLEKEERAKLPYSANIIDDIRIKENAHSRILETLLKYAGQDNSFPVYRSFIEVLKKKCLSIKNITIKKPIIEGQKENIDILIDESPSYSIIIENKVCWADDRPEQIEKYIKNVQAHNVDNENIFVIYLTNNGSKKVTDISLTAKAKEFLDFDDPKRCRYIEIDYKNDLLPMFESVAGHIAIDKEPILYSSLIQYIDYWKGKFSMRDGDNKVNQIITEYMAEKLNINNLQDCFNVSANIELLKKALTAKQQKLMKQMLNEKVIKPLKKCYGSEYGFELLETHLKMTLVSWKNAYIYIGKSKSNTVIIGVYGKNISNTVSVILEENKYKGFDDGYFKNVILDDLDSPEFWELVDNGKFLKELKKYINEIITGLEGRKL